MPTFTTRSNTFIFSLILLLYVKLLDRAHHMLDATDLENHSAERSVPTKKGYRLHLESKSNRGRESRNETALQEISVKSSVRVNPFVTRDGHGIPSIYKPGSWDGAPIVIEEYKLVFFTQGKVACTVFKQLFRRMMHFNDWKIHKEPNIPHNPAKNGLKYLYHFSPGEALKMMASPDWTRAIFVRDPKERVLSAYLDKAARKDGLYVHRHCCASDKNRTCAKKASKSFLGFVEMAKDQCCCDPHWKPQFLRIPKAFWKYVNFVGRFEHLADDTSLLLQRLEAREFADNGWGKHGNESIFSEGTSAKHQTSASAKTCGFYSDVHVHEMVETFYALDYLHPMLNFSRHSVSEACRELKPRQTILKN